MVIADPSQKTDELFEAMGRFVDDFGGTYITAEDVNVGIPDLRSVQRTTSHVTGLTVEEGGGGNPRAATALGCFLGVGAALLEASGSSDVAGKTVAVQGLGSVGFGLAEHLAEAGARVLATDVNPERIEHAVSELGVEVVDSDGIYGVECDVFAPCALGGVLNDDTIARLRCAVIAGAANNQLLDEVRHGEMLRERGIVYAPDYVINAGGVINISCELRPGGYDADAAVQKVHAIPRTLAEVFARARERGITTHAAAQELAEAALAAGPRQPPGRRRSAARARNAGTGSCSGCATTRTAPCSAPASAPTSSSSPTASANALCARSPPNGTSSSGDASPASTSPCVTAPIDTSETSTRPSLEGIAIASGFVPVSGGPPSGCGSRRGDVAVSAATRPPSARRRTQ